MAVLRAKMDRLLSRAALGGALLFVAGVGAGTWWALDQIHEAVRQSVQTGLTTVLANAREATHHWVTRQQVLVAGLASDRGLSRAVERLQDPRATARAAGDAISTISTTLEPAVRASSLQGFWILTPDGYPLYRSPDTLPADLPVAMQEPFERALDGLPTLSSFATDTLRPGPVAALAPIRDAHGQPIAALALALPARTELEQIAAQSHHRALGQVYFFDRTGRILGTSMAPEPWRDEARLVDPRTGRFTRMALAAIAGGSDLDLDGYTDHHGERVVGAWEWDPQLGIGIAVETRAADAYHVVETARRALLAALAITLLLFLAVLASVTQARRRALALTALQHRLAAVLESTTDPVCFADELGTPIYLNEAGRVLLVGPHGSPSAAISAARLLLRPEAREAAQRHGTWSGESTLLTADGRDLTLSQVLICHRTDAGVVDFYSTLARDITDRKQLERRLSEEKERAEVTLGSIGDAVIRTDAAGQIEYLNPVAEELLGCPASELEGRGISSVLTLAHESTREPLENPVETAIRERRVVGRSNFSLLVRPDGREFAIDESAAPITGGDGEILGAVFIFHDVSRARSLARQLAHQASHDFLTGLVNRHEFERRVGRALTRAQQDGVTHALCFLDLDQFKVVNDTCGHVAGDELLRQLAQALTRKVRRRDTLARLGGDEFGVLLEHCVPGQASRVAQDLLATIQEFRFSWEGKPFALGVSIGVVPITAESESLATILRDADAACYAAKERGRNRVHIYETNDVELAVRQGEMQWVSRITSALEEHRFRLYGQPIVPLITRPGEPQRVEVLLRMVDHDGTLIAPGAFIPAAERYNLMGAVDRWVVREVTALYERAGAQGAVPIASINLSGASLGDPTMLTFVREQLARHALSPATLCFEITETAAIANLGLAAHFIRELKAMGCWFALDDFGSGMSSFAYLQSLPVDALKIAGAFLRHIETDPVEHAMVEAITRVGHVMRLKVVAEGVENLDTLATLRAIGVDYAQGFAIAEPSPLEPLVLGPGLKVLGGGAAGRRGPASPPGSPRSRPAIA
ncbi:MAG: EAL domain-containing protein [Gemmatimonadota bacterium]|nr:EAL domain-containing protein [Gemmatimonadota bacterium]